MKKKIIITAISIFLLGLIFWSYKNANLNPFYRVGEAIDSLHHVKVFYNGGINHVGERRMANDYNIGLEFQCVEFVKRYYFEHYNHKMVDSYGHAVDFFQPGLADGKINKQRNLLQFVNPSISKPQTGDILVLNKTIFNSYGHVSIVSETMDNAIEVIQQNPGPFSSSREVYSLLQNEKGKWEVENKRVLGWLRMK